jgi:hypothetical protein
MDKGHVIMTSRTDQLPRIFQANAARFYERVIASAIESMPVHKMLVTGQAPTMDAFLDRCASQVENYTANEANKVYVLVLIALFERQLRRWAEAILGGVLGLDTRNKSFLDLLKTMAGHCVIDLDAHKLGATIEEAFEIGNVVRHGEGRALGKLRKLAPHLIDRSSQDYIDLLTPTSPDSEWVRIRPADVKRYASAIFRFWGLADTLPNAVTE